MAEDAKLQCHPWKDNVNFFALLQPTPLHPGSYSGDRLVQDYLSALTTYLDDKIYPRTIDLIYWRYN